MKKLMLSVMVILLLLLSTSISSFAGCEGDFDNDGDVDGSDLATFAADFGKTDCEVQPAIGLPKTGQTISYEIGDDGHLQNGVSWPKSRFTENGDGTVTDNLAGLVWLKNANCFGFRIWTDALSDCNGLADGQCGLTDDSVAGDWRLPNVRELQSLIDYGNAAPALPSGHPFTNVSSFQYWSSTTNSGATSLAWDVKMDNGEVVANDKSGPDLVWCVRSGL